jgi:hypothetical protein
VQARKSNAIASIAFELVGYLAITATNDEVEIIESFW